jgi:Ser/Thr protein kinase RdoA (MazF antagonist)
MSCPTRWTSPKNTQRPPRQREGNFVSVTGVARGPKSRATVSDSLFHALREHYGIRADHSARDIGGSSNLNLLVDEQGKSCVVRVYRPWITPARVQDMQVVRQRLAEGDMPTTPPIRTLTGESWIMVDNRVVEVEPHIEYDAQMDSWERLEAGLPMLGQIHSLLRGLDLSADGRNAPASNNIEPTEVLAGTRRGIDTIHQWDATPGEIELAEAAEKLAHIVAQAQRDFTDMPRQLVHGDYWDNNVLFREGQIVLVADLDFMGERARIDDLALTLYYTNSTYADDQTSDDRIHRLLKLVNAYDSGLDDPLTSVERAALPVALARAPLAFIAMIAAVDSEAEGRGLAAGMGGDIAWALAIARNLGRWQEVFAGV